MLSVLLVAAVTAGLSVPVVAQKPAKFSIARIYIEYNASANDLGYHVSLDGQNWRSLEIINPQGRTIFQVSSHGPYKDLGMTELFFEGAEPNLADFPLADLLALFPEGKYTIRGVTVKGGNPIVSKAGLTHAVPDGPIVGSEVVDAHTVIVKWTPVTQPPPGFPAEPISIVGYQVIVGSFQVTLPGSSTALTLPSEFVDSLASGAEQPFEVLAIEAGGNQTLTEGSFVVP